MTQTNPLKRILVVDDEPMIVKLLSTILREKGWDVTEAGSGSDGIEQLERNRFDVILTDLVMPGESGIDLLRAAREIQSDVEVILMTGYATADTAIEAMRHGAFHYIMKPTKPDEMVNLVEKAYAQRQLRRENRFLKTEVSAAHQIQAVVGDSEVVLKLVATLQGFAGLDDPVLLIGEPGTGRGFFARFLHFNSRRSSGLCVPVYCSGGPAEDLSAKIFGSPDNAAERGASTHHGKLELANHGTLYLADFEQAGGDILGRMERLLPGNATAPGEGVEKSAPDIRIVASSAVPMERLVEREDIPPALLKAFEPGIVRLPPLREHLEDVPLLLQHFLLETNLDRKKPLRGFTFSAISALQAYEWPGNVRELRNLVRAVAAKKKQGTMIDVTDIPPEILYRKKRTPTA